MKNITKRILKGLARAETPYVYLGKDQQLSYSFNDMLVREMIFSEHTPYAVLRKYSSRRGNAIDYRLFATDTYHEHHIVLEGRFDLLPAVADDGTMKISVHEELIDPAGNQVFERVLEDQEFVDGIEFSFMHMNRKYPSLKIDLINRIPGSECIVKKTSHKSNRSKKEVLWEYDIRLNGKNYRGFDRFTYARKDHVILGTLDPQNIPPLEGDTMAFTDFSCNVSTLSQGLSCKLEMAPICSPYRNVTREYQNKGMVNICSLLSSYLEDFTISSELSTKMGDTAMQYESKIPINSLSVKAGELVLCSNHIFVGGTGEVEILNDSVEQNCGERIVKYQRDQDLRILYGDHWEALVRNMIDCDLHRKDQSISMVDSLLDAKFR